MRRPWPARIPSPADVSEDVNGANRGIWLVLALVGCSDLLSAVFLSPQFLAQSAGTGGHGHADRCPRPTGRRLTGLVLRPDDERTQ